MKWNFESGYHIFKSDFRLEAEILIDAIEDWLESPELALVRHVRRGIQVYTYVEKSRPR